MNTGVPLLFVIVSGCIIAGGIWLWRSGSNHPPGQDRLIKRAFGALLIAFPFGFVGYLIHGFGGYTKGRLLRIRNRAALAALRLGTGWSAPAALNKATLQRISASERTTIGELWLTAARMEHASIAAFSQLSLHLCELGAPAYLLESTHQAALDEIEHSRLCYSVASQLLSQDQEAGPIRELKHSRGPVSFQRLAIGSLVDGCLAEGIAADVAQAAATKVDDPTIKSILERIAQDEERHGQLAWEILDWTLKAGPEDLAAIVAARGHSLSSRIAPALPPIPNVPADTLAAFGILDQTTLGVIATKRTADVVRQLQARIDVTSDLVRAAA